MVREYGPGATLAASGRLIDNAAPLMRVWKQAWKRSWNRDRPPRETRSDERRKGVKPKAPQHHHRCVSAWNKDPVFGVISIQSVGC